MTEVPLELLPRLERLCRARTHDSTATVPKIEAMPGHSGFSYGFVLEWRRNGSFQRESLVLRLPPPGARSSGPADVVRQGRLLRFLGRTSVPVARVRWLGSDPRWFGRPFSIVERLSGHTATLESSSPAMTSVDLLEAGASATRALCALHRLDPRLVGGLLGAPLALGDEISRWSRFHERAADPALVALAPELQAVLSASVPQEPRIGIVHGDYQWSNLLLGDAAVVAVLDWELAGIGAVVSDLGWLCLFSDAECWVDPIHLPLVPSPADLVTLYENARGGSLGEIAWYRALASYKFATIAAMNLGLHRRGKRLDPFYEKLAPSIPRMLERGLGLVDSG